MTNLYFPLPPARHLLSVITCSVWLEVTPPPVITIPVSLFLQRSINSQLVSIGYWSNLISTRTSLSSIEHVVGDGVVASVGNGVVVASVGRGVVASVGNGVEVFVG